ncbi:copper-binding protein [Pseudomonas sp. NPDC047963]|nr:copper-binding protein [Pseudomonas sp.]|tara:strand:+ start:817 stop:1200 length:384 start_codon:yes stop_codon:yes gene_type:complete
MNIKHITLATLFLIPAAYAADKMPMDSMPMDHKGMDMQMDHQNMDMPMGQKPAGQTATAAGTIKKMDMEKGTVTIAHGPVKALGWPSMTMGFKAKPDQLRTLKEGDQVEFEFSSKGMDSTITRIEKQ